MEGARQKAITMGHARGKAAKIGVRWNAAVMGGTMRKGPTMGRNRKVEKTEGKGKY